MDNHQWQLPGGLVDVGERLIDAVVRETKEETGVEIDVLSTSGIYESPTHDVVSIVFACTYKGGKLAASQESRAVAWVERAEVTSLVNEAYACRLLDSLEPGLHLRTTNEISLL